MSDAGCCEDPADITLCVLQRLFKCLGGEAGVILSFVFYLTRGAIGILLSGAECIVLTTQILDDDINLAPMMVITGLMIAAMIILGCMAVPVIDMNADDDSKRKAKNRFFFVFKLINLLFAGGILARIIVDWEEFAIEDTFKEGNSAKIFVVIGLAMDLFLDPIEVLLASCALCRS